MALSHFRGHDIDDIFNQMINPFTSTLGKTSRSAMRGIPTDFVEKQDHFEVYADMPGVTKEDIKLDVDGDVLTFGIEQKEEKEEHKDEAGMKWHRVERSSQYQRRAMRLPENADMDKLSAKYENGVLIVNVPKMEVQQPNAKRITIQ
jgi:HSP20 family protein